MAFKRVWRRGACWLARLVEGFGEAGEAAAWRVACRWPLVWFRGKRVLPRGLGGGLWCSGVAAISGFEFCVEVRGSRGRRPLALLVPGK
jgi:hypothetical protein